MNRMQPEKVTESDRLHSLRRSTDAKSELMKTMSSNEELNALPTSSLPLKSTAYLKQRQHNQIKKHFNHQISKTKSPKLLRQSISPITTCNY